MMWGPDYYFIDTDPFIGMRRTVCRVCGTEFWVPAVPHSARTCSKACAEKRALSAAKELSTTTQER